MNKRTQFRFAILLIVALLCGGFYLLSMPPQLHAQTNPIVLENQNPGTNAWRIDFNIGGFSDDVAQQVKGYASAVSVNHGQSIDFYVTVNPTQTYTIDVFRMGWYGGAGGRLMQSVGPLTTTPQPTCPIDPTTGMIACNWSVGYTLAVPANWTTGIYLAKLTNFEGFQSYIVFAVRDDERVADFIYQQPVNTYQAYNNYPADGLTGKSLYDFNSSTVLTSLGTQRAVKVSFDRPYGGSDGGGQFANEQWWEQYFISWAEREGYDISYSTDVDTHANGARLLSFKGALSMPHNEYWSKQMYDAFQTARDNGVDLAFFGANSIYWQVRYEPSSSGVPNRVLVGYKSPTLDPIADPALKTILWRDLNRPEQQLVGVQYIVDGKFEDIQQYVIKNSNHWVWANSGFIDGSSVPGLLGYEIDRIFPGSPLPSGTGYTVLAESPYVAINYDPPINETSQSSIYQAPNGAWVFASGTMSWIWALDRPTYVSTGIQQATKNILNRFRDGDPVPTPTNTPITPTDTPTNTPVTPTDTPIPPTDTPTNTPVTPTNTPITPTSAACTGQITAFRLWNLDTNTVVAAYNPILNNATIYLQDLPTNFNIDATVSGTLGSIRFDVNGLQSIENAAAYRAPAGDTTAWKPVVGNYVIAGTVYQNSGAAGAICSSNSINIVIANRPTPTFTALPPTETATNTPIACSGTGGIRREYWTNIANQAVSDLVNDPRFPNSPTGSNTLTSFEGPSNFADNYGTRIRGFLCPPVTGTYYFNIASDDNSDLYLSTDSNPANKRRIAYVAAYTNVREWSKFTEQRSAAIQLQSGVRYYIEALHKEGGGSDHVAVAWQGPGISQQVIAGQYLIPDTSAPPTSTATRTPVATATRTSTPSRTPTPLSGSVDRRISLGTDDSEESKTSGSININSSDIELGYDLGLTNTYQWCGLRFQNITVPKGATITNAYIEFTTASADLTGSSNLTIRGHATDNTATFTTSRYNISSRTRTNASVPWNNLPSWLINGAKNSTPNLKNIVQEIVNRNGWNSGNSLSFVIDGTGRHSAYAYENRSSAAARLVIQWTMGRSVLPEIPSEDSDDLTPKPVLPALTLDYTTAAPNSQLTLVGQHFAANVSVAVLLNGNLLTNVHTDANGDFLTLIATGEHGEGQFTLSIEGQPTTATSYQVAQGFPLYTQSPDESEYPEENTLNERVFLPIVTGGD